MAGERAQDREAHQVRPDAYMAQLRRVPRSADKTGREANRTKCINLSGEVSPHGSSGFQSTHSSSDPDGSNVGGSVGREISKRRISRGDELAKGKTDSRSGEGLKPQENGTPEGFALINADRRASSRSVWIQTVITAILEWLEVTAIKQTA